MTWSGTGEVTTEKITIENGKLTHTVAAEFSLDPSQGRPEPQDIAANTIELEFWDVADRAPLKELATTNLQTIATPNDSENSSNDADRTNTKEAKAAELQKIIDGALASGAQVFEGTVRVLSYSEVLQLQGIADPNPGTDAGSQFAILVFDNATDVTGYNGDGQGTRTEKVKMLLLDSYEVSIYGSSDSVEQVNRWKVVNGKNVVVAGKQIVFPSDTRLPLGEPSITEATLLSK